MGKISRQIKKTERVLGDKPVEYVKIKDGILNRILRREKVVYHKTGEGRYSVMPLGGITRPLEEKARASNRKRAAFAFAPASDKIERRHLLNFVNKNSYIPPHMHPTAVESWKVTSGKFKAIIMNERGNVVRTKILTPLSRTFVTQPGTYHTIVALKEGSILHEEVPGPYDPKTYKVQQPWAPAEGTPEAEEYFKKVLEKNRRR